MKNISSLPQEFQNIFAELKAEQDAEQAIDGTQTQASKEDIQDEKNLLDAEIETADENDEEQVDMDAVSPAMLAMFN
jgi:hypothetical protein